MPQSCKASRSLVLAVSLKQQNTSETEYQIFAFPNHFKTISFLCNETEWNTNMNFFCLLLYYTVATVVVILVRKTFMHHSVHGCKHDFNIKNALCSIH